MKQTDLPTLPSLPGIYLYKAADGAILYIGKAKNIKKRVTSYFRNTHDWKILTLLEQAATIEHIITHTEVEAMLLEAELIGQHKPKFNVLLTSGQPFVYLLFTKETLPQLKVVRNKKEKGAYFGPFLHKRQARSVAHFLINTFKLNVCNQTIANGCLDYHIGRCAGSCMPTFDADAHLFNIELAKDALRTRHATMLKKLTAKMKEYTAALAFEKAQRMHQHIQDLDTIFSTLQAKYDPAKYAPDIFLTTHTQQQANYNAQACAEELHELAGIDLGNKQTISIDCFDISHFQSNSIVGSCVRFTDGQPDKKQFRRFAIRSITRQHDYAALQEIVTRRYKDAANLPDIILIDGGKGQRSAVKQILTQYPDIPVLSLAKREELLHSDVYPQGTHLDLHSHAGKLLIALRDYAHHFAISYHTLKRKKAFTQRTYPTKY